MIQVHKKYFVGNPDTVFKDIVEPEKTNVSIDHVRRMLEEIVSYNGKDIFDLLTTKTKSQIKNSSQLTNGDVYMIISDILKSVAGITYN